MEDDFKIPNYFESNEVQGCINVIQSILNYKLSANDRQPFLYFHNFVSNPQPDFLTKWREDIKKEPWYHKFVNGILGDVQNSLACVLYHYDRLVDLENSVMEGIEKYNYRDIIERNSTIGLGSTLIWDFEYQAFILAYRRCLDYMARAICTYFMNDFHSFRKLSEYLTKLDRPIATDKLISVIKKYSPEFEFVLSEGNRKSTRDKISHYEYVTVGAINLSQRGFMLAGGEENLTFQNGRSVQLSEVLHKKVSNLRNCITELIFTYVDSIKSEENQKKK